MNPGRDEKLDRVLRYVAGAGGAAWLVDARRRRVLGGADGTEHHEPWRDHFDPARLVESMERSDEAVREWPLGEAVRLVTFPPEGVSAVAWSAHVERALPLLRALLDEPMAFVPPAGGHGGGEGSPAAMAIALDPRRRSN